MSASGENVVLGKWLLLSLGDCGGDVFEQIDSSGRPGNFYLTQEGEWRLNAMGAMRAGYPLGPTGEPPDSGIDTIYGKCVDGSLRSLFGAIPRKWPLMQDESSANVTWGGQWWGGSDTHLVAPADRTDRVELRFECLADWAGDGQAYAGNHSRVGYDHESRTSTVPDEMRYEASGPGYEIVLWRGTKASYGVGRMSAESVANITISAETSLDRVHGDWVRPIRNLLAFLTLETVEAPEGRCRLIDEEWTDPLREPLVELHYPTHHRERENRSDNTVANRAGMLATLGQLQSKGLDFGSLLRNFLKVHSGDHATAISYINEVESGRLDRSIDSKLLHTIRALEIYCKEKGIKKNLAKQIDFCIELSGPTGAEISGLWEARQDHRPLRSTANSARKKVAHGEPAGSDEVYSDLHCHYLALKWIVRHLYLLEMGLPETGVADIMGQCQPFQDDKDILKRYIR